MGRSKKPKKLKIPEKEWEEAVKRYNKKLKNL